MFTNQCIGVLLGCFVLNMVFWSTTLCIATLVFLFNAYIRLPASDSLTCLSLPVRTNIKLLAAIGKFSNSIGKLMIGKTLATSGEEITSAMICNDALAIYW